MKSLIESGIQWETIGDYEKSAFHYEVDRAAIQKETGILSIYMTLDFIMPYQDMERLSAQLIHKLAGIHGVKFHFHYDNVILRSMDIVRLFIPHMIDIVNGEYTAITKTIQTDNFQYQDGRLDIYALGKFSTEQLNQQVAKLFENLLRDTFSIETKVIFHNNEELYEKTFEEMVEGEKKDMEEAKRQAEAAAKQRQALGSSPSSPNQETGNFGFGSGGGQGSQSGNGGQTGGKGGWKRKEKELPAEGNRIMGHNIVGDANVSLMDIDPSQGMVIVEGILFKKSFRVIRSGNYLITLLITDEKTTTICCKCFASENKWNEIDELLKPGDGVKIRGEVQFDTFENMNTIMIKDIEKKERVAGRQDTCEMGRRVELHAHTKMSAMDGLNEVSDLVRQAAEWGQPAVAITDHGVVQAFPDAAKEAKKQAEKGREIKIIYGMEGYVFDDADCMNEDGTIDYKKKPTNHIILLARTQEGLKNIYKLVSMSHLDYFYKRPRLPWSVLSAHREGLIIGSACEAGEVYRAILNGEPEERIEAIAERYDYLEIQPLINNRFLVEQNLVDGYDTLKTYNQRIVALADKLGKPVVATTDSHYQDPESAIYRNILMAGQGYKDAENGQGLFLRTTDEMLEEFSYLGEETAKRVVIENTNLIASMIEDVLPVPKGKYPPKIEGAEKTLRDTCMETAHEMYGDPLPDRIGERLEKELSSIINNGYAVMYVSAQMLVQKSLSDGYLVGSRGSVGSSLAATMAGITEVNPLEPHYVCPNCKNLEWGDMDLYDCGIDMPEKDCPVCGTPMRRDGYTIPFATFLGFDGDKEPDIDLNFAGEYQPIAHKYVGVIFGEKNVFKAGTVGTVADKTAYGYVMKFFEETHRPINKFEADRLTQHCTGVKRTTGQHPGGIIIVPDDHEIYEFCPVQHPANDVNSDIITTHFDYHKIDQNLLKLDILGHNVPSMIRQLQDMTGIDPLTVDLTDRTVLSIFNGIEALKILDPENYRFKHGTYAIPEFGTSFTRQMLDDTKPDKFADLVRISGFSHGTDVWLNNAQDYIRSGVATMREVISTRDDIMNYLMLKGIENKMSFKIMEDVRKNRPLKEEQLTVMKEHGVPDWYIDSCIKIQYMFPRAHAVAYVMMSFRMAWYKVYYPREFYATHFTSVVANFDAETILKGPEAVLERMDAIVAMGTNATPKEKEDILVLEVAYEMYARGYEFAPARLGKSFATKFWVDDGKVLLPFVAVEGVGETAAKSFAAAYEEKTFDTIEEAIQRGKLNRTAAEGLRAHGVFAGLPETDQLCMF
ncbi:MAG: PolC-type DNA polymerase III [Firmicutes bacterium]|nr:PolC-type DNA polymerase III [Bacillota bacterium]